MRTRRVLLPLIIAAALLLPLAKTGAQPATAGSVGYERIGTTVLGRPIVATCIGAGDRTVVGVAGLRGPAERPAVLLARALVATHAREPSRLPAGTRLCLIPLLDRDAPVRARTADAAVDGPLPAPPETRALAGWLEQVRPNLTVIWRCCLDAVHGNAAADPAGIADAYRDAARSGYLYDRDPARTSAWLLDALDSSALPAIEVQVAAGDPVQLDLHLAGLDAAIAASRDGAQPPAR